MGSADPTADDPYDCLGVSRSDSLDTIEPQAKKLITEHMKKVQDASSESKKKEYKEAWENLQDAFEEVKQQKKGASSNRRILHASASPSTVKLGEETTISVEDDKGNSVDDCMTKIDGRRKGRTDNNGEATIEPQSTGEVTIDVVKDASGGVSYRDTSVSVSVKKRTMGLNFADVPDRVDSGDKATLTVQNDRGTTVKDVDVAGPSDSETTDGSGEATITMTGDGQATVRANRPDTSTTTYSEATTTIKVDPRTVDLKFKSGPKAVQTNDKVSFVVVGDNGPIDNAKVSVGGDTGTTDNKGRTQITLSTVMPGTHTVEATKKDDPGVTYTTATRDLTVNKANVDLSISVDDSSPTVDEEIGIEVTDGSGNGIKDARVSVEGDEKARTNQAGEAEIQVEKGGRTRISATKPDDKRRNYSKTHCYIGVERHVNRIKIEGVPSMAETGESVDVLVVDSSGTAVSNAVVKTDSGLTDQTGRGGEATVEFTAPGTRELVAKKSPTEKIRYEKDSATIQIERPERKVRIVEGPDEAKQGEQVQIRVKDTHGNYISDATVRTSLNDQTTTDSSGRATLTLNQLGLVRIVVSVQEPDFEDTDSINVVVS